MSTAAIWAEPPILSFPPFFVKTLDIEQMLSYLNERIEACKDRISKRQEEETKKRLEKQEKVQRELDNILE